MLHEQSWFWQVFSFPENSSVGERCHLLFYRLQVSSSLGNWTCLFSLAQQWSSPGRDCNRSKPHFERAVGPFSSASPPPGQEEDLGNWPKVPELGQARRAPPGGKGPSSVLLPKQVTPWLQAPFRASALAFFLSCAVASSDAPLGERPLSLLCFLRMKLLIRSRHIS